MYAPLRHGLTGSCLLSVNSEEGRGATCGLGRSPAGCDPPAVAGLGKAEEKGGMWLSLPELPTALTTRRTWEMWQGEFETLSSQCCFLGSGGSEKIKLFFFS